MSAYWKKILADLWRNKARSLLSALSITVGVFAVGLIATVFINVKQDMLADYQSIRSHTVRIFTSNFEAGLVHPVEAIPGVAAAEARYSVWFKAVGSDGNRYPINLDSIRPLSEMRVDTLFLQKGSPILRFREIYLERAGADGLGIAPGDNVELVLNNGETRILKVVGTLHDVNANPFRFSKSTAGYVTPQTMEWLGESSQFNYLTIATSGPQTDVDHIRAIAENVAARIERAGVLVYNIHINNPGKHPAQSIIDSVLMLMAFLGVMSVFLSGFLIINTVSALMAQQVRQIGVMKAIGATVFQLTGMYFALVMAFGLLALILAVPLSALAGMGLSRWMIGMLNASPSPFTVPAAALYLQTGIALGVPLLSALFPVLRGARLTVREAINSYGLRTPANNNLFDRLLEKIKGLPRPLLLSLRNAFAQKSRLLLTLAALTLGGAIFIAVLSVRESMKIEVARTFSYHQADVNVEFAAPQVFYKIQNAMEDIPGMAAIEGWNIRRVNVMHADGEHSDQVILYAPPSDTHLVKPILTAGRWLKPDDTNAIVVDNHFIKARPDVQLGDEITMRIERKEISFKVVGIFRLASNQSNPFTFVNNAYLEHKMGPMINSLRITTTTSDPAFQAQVLEALQERFEERHIQATLQTGSDAMAQSLVQVDLVIYLLLFMAVLIAVVGGLGLTGTMSMNVLERTREIGVMRSIGAVNGVIFQLVVVEGLLVGLISWILSVPLAIPLTHLLDEKLGTLLMTLPLFYTLSARGIVVWLFIILLLAVAASLLPARNAVRLTIREVLAYE